MTVMSLVAVVAHRTDKMVNKFATKWSITLCV